MMMVALLQASPSLLRAQVNTDQVMRVGRNALYFEDYMVAIQYFNQVIGAKPYLPQPYFLRSVAKISLDDYAGAEADASKALELNPFITGAYEVRGVARHNLGRTADALADYEAVLRDDPDNRNVLYNKAMAEMSLDSLDRAWATAERIVSRNPSYDGAYRCRARVEIARGDSVAALADIARAIELNANAPDAHVMRAELSLKMGAPADSVLPDMDMAIKLLPQETSLYINRAILRYQTDDYIGALEDYDYALSLEPLNAVALFNRAMLRAEIHDYNRSIDDFSAVLRLQPNQYRALFNRAALYREIGELDLAYADMCRVIEAFPTFAAAYYMRGEIDYHRGHQAAAQRDYNKSISLARSKVEMVPDLDVGGVAAGSSTASADADGDIFSESQEEVAERFASLITVDNLSSAPTGSYTGATRGLIQNTAFAVELEPMFTLSYYTEASELKMRPDFVREVDALNATGSLPLTLYVTTHEPAATDNATITRHFSSIEYYTSYIANHPAVAADYFARAMDFMTLRNYQQAIADLDRATAVSPDFALAKLLRAVARWKLLQSGGDNPGGDTELSARDAAIRHNAAVNAIVDDLDDVIRLSPSMAVAHYNRGVVLAHSGDLAEAMRAFDRAIELNPSMGEAWFNRGYVNLKLGNKSAAFTDLSRAGELGVAPSYNLLKRMSQ